MIKNTQIKLTHEQLISQLKQKGYRFRHFALQSQGNYSVEDALWNYRDAIAHIPMIHSKVRNIPVINHQDGLASIFLQRVFGLEIPIVVVDYEANENTQTAFTTCFCFVLIVHNVCTSLGPNEAKVTTNYHLGGPPWLTWLFPFIRWILKRNYRVLMNTDIPLRQRRGELRRWGYDFHLTDYREAAHITNQNWRLPSEPISFEPVALSETHLKTNEEQLVGRNDHLGLRLKRTEDRVHVFPRMCPHEGASLDVACVSDRKNCLECPWHGRNVPEWGSLRLDSTESCQMKTPYHQVTWDPTQNEITITPLA